MKKLEEIVDEATDLENLRESKKRRFITGKTWRKRARELSPVMSPERRDKEFYGLINDYLGEEVVELEKIRTERSKRTKEIVEKNKEIFPLLEAPEKEIKKFKYQKIHEKSRKVFLPDFLISYNNEDRRTLSKRLETLYRVRKQGKIKTKEIGEKRERYLNQLVEMDYLSHHLIPKKRKNRAVKTSGMILTAFGLISTGVGLLQGSIYPLIGGGILSLAGVSIFQSINPEKGPFNSEEYRIDPEIGDLIERFPQNYSK